MSSPDPSFRRSAVSCCSWFHEATEIVSAVIEQGSHPFPFRTRQLSPASPMVPGLRVRESRSPLDSRPPRGKPPGGLFLFVFSPWASRYCVARASLAVRVYGFAAHASPCLALGGNLRVDALYGFGTRALSRPPLGKIRYVGRNRGACLCHPSGKCSFRRLALGGKLRAGSCTAARALSRPPLEKLRYVRLSCGGHFILKISILKPWNQLCL